MKPINKKEIHSGYVVELANHVFLRVGRVGDFVKVLYSTDGRWCPLNCWDDNLKWKFNQDGIANGLCNFNSDIIKVWGSIKDQHYFKCLPITYLPGRPLLWQRVKQMTLEEISEALGYEVEIVER